ncbi:MAG TPA: lipase maturation factor family protein, partial [Tepidisphaeraceae bacterium]|nr:lipase maturation factor family protein [Tepidisphaeraceae bacterium]
MPETPLQRPVMIYDGQCFFCQRWVERWRRNIGHVLDFEPYQQAAGRFPQIDPTAFGQAVHLVEPDGRVSRGAEAVLRAHALAGRRRGWWWAYRYLPGFSAVAEQVYSTIAAHREAADQIDLQLLGRRTDIGTHRLTRQVFLRSLGVIYVIAFGSLWVQINGLIGSGGILPIDHYLQLVNQRISGSDAIRLLPTLCWFNSSDSFLQTLCGGGVAAGLAVIAGIAQLPALVVAFVCYLSLTVAGQVFLGFQWDALLLEAGFLSIFFAPWEFWSNRSADNPRISGAPSSIILWLLRWLLFRVMFTSGIVKLTSADVAWRGWTAMQYHYETQPLPPWTAWYFFQLPAWFQKASCGVVFFAELIVPLLIFGPRRVRLVAFWLIVLFQCLIIATGNYGFFNLLTIALCFTLPDDSFWRWLVRRPEPPIEQRRASRWRWPVWITAPIAAVLLAVTIPVASAAFERPVRWPRPILALYEWIAPLRIANSYGLFAIMTTERPEIIIEGSDDGVLWKAYAFKWKPGDVTRRPAF